MKLDIPFHPLIFGLFPVYQLYAENLGAVHPGDLLIPTILIVICTALVFGTGILLRWDVRKTGIGLSGFFVWLFSYGFVLQWYSGLTLAGIGLSHYPRYLVALFGILLVLGIWMLRKPWDPELPTRFLNVVGVVLLFLTMLTLISQLVAVTPVQHGSSASEALPGPVSCSWNSTGDRDVYYIILDTYARDDVLERDYHYDNRGFLANLTARGFIITTGSLANYPDSSPSLASSLNMEYLESPSNSVNNQDLIEYNRISRIFQEHGYTVIHFRSGYAVTDRNAYADVVKNERLPTPFQNRLAGSTILRYIVTIPSRRYAIDNAFSELSQLPERNDRKFVVAHIANAVHPPFTVGKEGEWLLPRFGDEDYLNQLQYINGRVEYTIDRILAESEPPPIIILQADHGPKSVNGEIRNVSQSMPIFNAYYLPGVHNPVVYDTITPVNNFRVILNAYYGCNLTLLDDQGLYDGKWYTPEALLPTPGT